VGGGGGVGGGGASHIRSGKPSNSRTRVENTTGEKPVNPKTVSMAKILQKKEQHGVLEITGPRNGGGGEK